jgi:hypothetical protein
MSKLKDLYGDPTESAESGTELVDADPFVKWLERTDRSGWTNRLTESQMRYVERILKKRPRIVNVHSVDDLLIHLDKPFVLNSLYPA